MSHTTSNVDILKQLFNNLSDKEKQTFISEISNQNTLKKVIEPKEVELDGVAQADETFTAIPYKGNHKSFNKRSKGLFNIQTVNSYHSRLKDLIIHRFKGVATKYLNNYLVYHNFVNFTKGTLEGKETILFDFIRSTTYSSKTIDIAVRPAIPI